MRERDEHTGDERPDDLADAAHGEVEAVGGRDEVGRHDARDDRAPGRGGDGEHRGLDGDQAEDEPDVAQVEQGLDEQGEGDDPATRRGPQVESAPVDGVGDRTAVEAEDHDGHEPRETDVADVEGRVGQGPDLDGDGDMGEHRADERGALADQQPAVGSHGQGPGVDRVAGEQATEAAGLLRRVGGVRRVTRRRVGAVTHAGESGTRGRARRLAPGEPARRGAAPGIPEAPRHTAG